MVDIQLIRFKTDLSYGEYKKQNTENVEKIKNQNETIGINVNNIPQIENINTPNTLETINKIEIK